MADKNNLTRTSLRTPKAAAIAGIVFSILLVVIVSLLRLAVPDDPLEPGAWLSTNSKSVALAINLVPFDGVAFLWFIGVLRDRLGQREDRFFSTVFFGSGLLFLAMLFTAGGVIAAIIFVFATEPENVVNSTGVDIRQVVSDRTRKTIRRRENQEGRIRSFSSSAIKFGF